MGQGDGEMERKETATVYGVVRNGKKALGHLSLLQGIIWVKLTNEPTVGEREETTKTTRIA